MQIKIKVNKRPTLRSRPKIDRNLDYTEMTVLFIALLGSETSLTCWRPTGGILE